MNASASPEYLTSPLLLDAGFRHAFFTRQGGVSSGPYASLNFSYGVGDAAECVDENLRRAADTLAVPQGQVYFLSQVHGDVAVELFSPTPQKEVWCQEGDALVSAYPELACGVRTADCVPVLVADQSTGRVAAIHAGWRGIVAEVIKAGLKLLGGDPKHWVAAIGPHISVSRFEVSEEVASAVERVSSPDCIAREAGRKPHVDLRRAARNQLLNTGMSSLAIDDVEGCTQSDAANFFSFRRDGKHSGRHLSAIVPRG